VNAVVLAGGPLDDVAGLEPGAPNKAFVRIGDRTLVGRVLAPLRTSAQIERIVVVTPPSMWEHPDLRYADELRPDGARISESLRSGLSGLAPDRGVLIVTSDLPILSVAAIDDFAVRVNGLNADVVYGCVEQTAHVARFPEVPHTWARMRDGTFCGGGLAAIKPRSLPLLERFIERLGAARKHPLRLASLFGWDMLARFALRRLSIAQAETRATRILGAPVRALVSSYADMAVNVDRVSDVELARRLVSANSANASV
jgi:GTP:adenosylcobinamide-phosphate guanylyltransferase